MGARTGTDHADNPPTSTTSKQVQAWFLRLSRDRWKNKAQQKNAELKRLRQRVADVDASRTRGRETAEATPGEIERLRAQDARLQARLDQQAEDASKKKRPTSPA
jgi:predicted  nucleic acid-binding Zn-ribbon protein